MAFDPEFLDLMPHTITVQAMVASNEYGEEVYSTQTSSFQALVEERPQWVRSAFGEETVATAIAYVASTDRIPITSLVTLPDGSTPAMIRSDVFSDEDGIHHNVLFFGSGAAAGGGG
jgi:hypothetical protein